MKIKKIQTPLDEVVEKFNNAFDEISPHLINRSDELKALKLCLLTRSHLMLEGPAGVAKSKLSRLGFKTVSNADPESETDVDDIIRFEIQMMANTQAEEIFGPMSIKELRENERIHYNTTGMLPNAHFARLDEVYRGSDSVLTTMMGILHERIFHNGPIIHRCPLITAVGTTNFITDKPELDAFHDRWLITCTVNPADSAQSRRKILDLFLEEEDVDSITISDPITLRELERMQAAVRKVVIPPLLKDLYEDLASKYRASVGDVYLSDRRFVQASRLIQASILLATGGADTANPDAGFVAEARYALMRSSSKEHREAMDDAITKVIGNYERHVKEAPEIEALEKSADSFFRSYDENNDKSTKERQLRKVEEILNRLATISPSQMFTVERHVSRLKAVLSKLEDLKMNLRKDLNLDA